MVTPACSKKLISSAPYGPQFTITKIECKNHLMRNYTNKLKELQKNTTYLLKDRKLLESRINKLRMAVTSAAQYWREADLCLKEKIVRLRQEILNGPKHVFGEHEDCIQESVHFYSAEKRLKKIQSGEVCQ